MKSRAVPLDATAQAGVLRIVSPAASLKMRFVILYPSVLLSQELSTHSLSSWGSRHRGSAPAAWSRREPACFTDSEASRKKSPTRDSRPVARESEAAAGRGEHHPEPPAARGRGASGRSVGRTRSSPPLPTAGGEAADLPRGLMVFSVASFSLEPPLDMSAAMEKALAREESWGLGDAVNSMAPRTRSCAGTGLAEAPSSFPEGDKARHTALSSRGQSQRGRGPPVSHPQTPESPAPASPLPRRQVPGPQSLGARGEDGRRATAAPGALAPAWQDHRLRRGERGTSTRRAPSASPSLPRGGARWPRRAAPRTLRAVLAAPRLNLRAAPSRAAGSQSAPPHVTASRPRAGAGPPGERASRAPSGGKGRHPPAGLRARGRCAPSRGGPLGAT